MLRSLMYFPLSCYKNVTRSASLSGNVVCIRDLIMSGEIFSPSLFHISSLHMTAVKFRNPVQRKMEMEYESINKAMLKIRTIDQFPDVDLPNRLFHGVPFKDLPVVHIKSSKNNTLLTMSDGHGHIKFTWSCGMEGFKNAKEGTNVAVQLTALNFARKAVDSGIVTVRLKIRGMGVGRNTAVKALVSGGLEIVSVTDCTPVSDKYLRPKKLRRV